MKIFVISDRYYHEIKNKSEGILDVDGSNSVEVGVKSLTSYKSGELNGVLVVLSASFPEEQIPLLSTVIFACRYMNVRLVIYAAKTELMNNINQFIEESDTDNVDILVIPTVKEFTEKFLKELFTAFTDKIYTLSEDSASDMNEIISRVQGTSTNNSDALKILKGLVEDTINSNVSVNLSLDEMKKDESFQKDDVTKLIKEKISTYQTDESIPKGIVELLELLAESRKSTIKQENLKRILHDIEEDTNKRIGEVDFDFSKIDDDELEQLKLKKSEIEKSIKEILITSSSKVKTIFNLLSSKSLKEKTLLAQQKIKPDQIEVAKEIINEVKLNVANAKSLKNNCNNIISEWNTSINRISQNFEKYVVVTNKIEEKQSLLIDELQKSKNIVLKVNSDLAAKMYVLSCPITGVGGSTVALGLASNTKRPLILDLRLTSNSLSLHVPQAVTLEELVDVKLEVMEQKILSSGGILVPGLVDTVINDRKGFLELVLNALEKCSTEFTQIIVLVDGSDYSNVFLDYTAVCMTVTNTNIINLNKTRKMLMSLDKKDNIKFKYIIYTPCPKDMNLDKMTSLLGVPVNKYRAVGIPFLSIDVYKNEEKNIFEEKPLTKSFFKI